MLGRIAPYLLVGVVIVVLTFMWMEFAPFFARLFGGFGYHIQVGVVLLPAATYALGSALEGNRSPLLERISKCVSIPSILIFIQVMFTTGQVPSKRGGDPWYLPWYPQLTPREQELCDFRSSIGWVTLAVLFIFIAWLETARKRRSESQ